MKIYRLLLTALAATVLSLGTGALGVAYADEEEDGYTQEVTTTPPDDSATTEEGSTEVPADTETTGETTTEEPTDDNQVPYEDETGDEDYYNDGYDDNGYNSGWNDPWDSSSSASYTPGVTNFVADISGIDYTDPTAVFGEVTDFGAGLDDSISTGDGGFNLDLASLTAQLAVINDSLATEQEFQAESTLALTSGVSGPWVDTTDSLASVLEITDDGDVWILDDGLSSEEIESELFGPEESVASLDSLDLFGVGANFAEATTSLSGLAQAQLGSA